MDHVSLLREAASFRKSRDAFTDAAKIDLCMSLAGAGAWKDLKQAAPAARDKAARLIRRAIDRERMRGLARHRLYSLDRHISLKRALDAVLSLAQTQNGAEAPSWNRF
jgi:hypothetical protein